MFWSFLSNFGVKWVKLVTSFYMYFIYKNHEKSINVWGPFYLGAPLSLWPLYNGKSASALNHNNGGGVGQAQKEMWLGKPSIIIKNEPMGCCPCFIGQSDNSCPGPKLKSAHKENAQFARWRAHPCVYLQLFEYYSVLSLLQSCSLRLLAKNSLNFESGQWCNQRHKVLAALKLPFFEECHLLTWAHIDDF